MMHVIIARGSDRRRLRRRPHRRLRRARRARRASTRPSGPRRIPASRPRTSARWPASTPTTQPSVIRIGVAVERHAGGGQTVRAIACLPALVGAWRHVGGGILQLPLWAFPVNWDALHAARTASDAGHPRRQPVPARAGADRRAAARPADQGAVRLQLQPGGGRAPTRTSSRAGWRARTCSPSSASTS